MAAVIHSEWPDPSVRPLVIGIAGGSGSGKTTIAHAIVEPLSADDVSFLEHDAYYRDQRDVPFEERVRTNYDHPDSLETDLLVRHIGDLRAGHPIEKPVYDFAGHTRTDATVEVKPTRVVVVEGILILVEPALREVMDLRIYVDTDADLRLMRRLQRDIEERGRTVESVMRQYLATVRPMHLQFVEPSKRYADIIIPEGYNPGAVGTVTSMIRDYLASA